MIKKLAVPLFIIGLATYGCGGDSDPKKKDASSSGGSGGSSLGGRTGQGGSSQGGSGGGSSQGGSGGSSQGGSGGSSQGGSGGSSQGGSGGSAGRDGGSAGAGGSAGRDGGTAGRDGGSTDGGSAGVNWATCREQMTGVTVAEFCARYSMVCKFGAAKRFASMDECMMKYTGTTTALRTCISYHLCMAKENMNSDHCDHAAQPGVAGTPCAN